MFSPELKKGSVELLILTVLRDAPLHGYEISKRIERRSTGRLQFNPSTLYPVLYRMQERGWIEGSWVEQPGERRRRHYHLTPKGENALEQQIDRWREFADAVNAAIAPSHA